MTKKYAILLASWHFFSLAGVKLPWLRGTFFACRCQTPAYMEWLFSILFELEKRLDISSWNSYDSRVYGFVAERLLDVWIEHNQINYTEQNVSFIEKQNWIKKGGLFLKRKLFYGMKKR